MKRKRRKPAIPPTDESVGFLAGTVVIVCRTIQERRGAKQMYLYCQTKHLEKALHSVRLILTGILKKRNARKWDNSCIRKLKKKDITRQTIIARIRAKFLNGVIIRSSNINIKGMSIEKTKISHRNKSGFGVFSSFINNLLASESAVSSMKPISLLLYCLSASILICCLHTYVHDKECRALFFLPLSAVLLAAVFYFEYKDD